MDFYIDDGRTTEPQPPIIGSDEVDRKKCYKLLKKANGVIQQHDDFNKAITICSKALNLPGLKDEERALILINRNYCYTGLLYQKNNPQIHDNDGGGREPKNKNVEGKLNKEQLLKELCAHALRDAITVTQIFPRWYKGYYRAGKVYHALQVWHESKRCYTQALQLRPQDEKVLIALAEVRFDERRMNAAQYFPQLVRSPQSQQKKQKQDKKVDDDKNDQKVRPGCQPSLKKMGTMMAMDFEFSGCGCGCIDSGQQTDFELLRGITLEAHMAMMKGDNVELSKLAFVMAGHRYKYGLGVNVDIDMAVKMYAIASDAGNVVGHYHMGKAWLMGEASGSRADGGQDIEAGLRLLQLAAGQPTIIPGTRFRNRGVMEAQCLLGNYFQQAPYDGKPDYTKAVAWYKIAVNNGSAEAGTALGRMYRDAIGVTKDVGEAIKFFIFAAELGHIEAMECLGWMYAEEGDPDTAINWYIKAIQLGSENALIHQKKFEQMIAKRQKYLNRVKSTIRHAKSSCRPLSRKGLRSQIIRHGDPNTGSSGNEGGKKKMGKNTPVTTTDALPKIDEEIRSLLSKCEEVEAHLCQFAQENPSSYAAILVKSMTSFEKAMGAMKNYKNIVDTIGHPGADEIDYKPIQRLSPSDGGLPPNLYQICDLRFIAIKELAQSLRETDTIATFEAVWYGCLETLIGWTILNKAGVQCAEDCDARICSACLQMESPEKCLQFNMESLQKYPNEKFFHRGRSNLLAFSGNFEQGIEETAASLKIFPNDPELLYARASMLKFLWGGNSKEKEKAEDVKNEYLKFLQWAPPDHKNVPDACFTVAMTILVPMVGLPDFKERTMLTVSDEDLVCSHMAFEFFKRGVMAGEALHPCFLPFTSKTMDYVKDLVRNRMPKVFGMDLNKLRPGLGQWSSQFFQDGRMGTGTDADDEEEEEDEDDDHCDQNFVINIQQNPVNNTKSIQEKRKIAAKHVDKSQSLDGMAVHFSMNQLTTDTRLALCIKHRRMINKIIISNDQSAGGEGKKILKKDAILSLPNGKNVLPKMEKKVSAISFDDFVLTCHVIEDPIIFKSHPPGQQPDTVHLVILMHDGQVNRCVVHTQNFNDRDELREKFKYGSTITIVDPCMNRMDDGSEGRGFVVEDLKTIIFHRSCPEMVTNGRKIMKKKKDNNDDEGKAVCRFCWKINPTLTCGKCRRVSYCGRECQMSDWKLLKHKLICVPELDQFI